MAENDEQIAILSAEAESSIFWRGRYSNGVPNLDLILKAHSGDSVRVIVKLRGSGKTRQPGADDVLESATGGCPGSGFETRIQGQGIVGPVSLLHATKPPWIPLH